MEAEKDVVITPALQAEIHAYVLELRRLEPKINFTKVKSKVKKKFGIILS